jgi:serine/threonine protein kinase
MESINIDLTNELPKIRKILDNSTARQKTEIEIVKKIRDNPQSNIVDIYEVVEPTKTENGYISQEVLIPLEDENATILQIDERVIDYLDTLDRDLEAALSQLHSLCIVYIDLHIGNVGWSTKDQCWKIFDFDHSGILKNDAGVCLEDEWEIEPEEAIKYRTIKKRRQTTRSQTAKSKSNSPKTKKKNYFNYDKEAKILFNEEKNKVKKNTKGYKACRECNKLTRKRTISPNDRTESCKRCAEIKKKLR